jgi:hypothetical protein
MMCIVGRKNVDTICGPYKKATANHVRYILSII